MVDLESLITLVSVKYTPTLVVTMDRSKMVKNINNTAAIPVPIVMKVPTLTSNQP